MGKVTLPYIERSRAKGRDYYRYRRGMVRFRLPADPSSPEFMAEYRRIHEGYEAGQKNEKGAPAPGSITALVRAYIGSAEYRGLAPTTRSCYGANLDDIEKRFGRFPAKGMTRAVALTWRDAMQDRPAAANKAIAVMQTLYRWGVNRGMVKENPVQGVKKLRTGEYRPWSMEEINVFRAHAPAHLTLALDLALHTGQRQGDVLAMRWNHIEDGGIMVTQQKTGAKLWVPLHPALKARLDETGRVTATILAAPSGEPWKSDHFKHVFKKTTKAAGLPDDLVFHGLRKAATVFLAEAGCSGEQIKSITGHKTDAMVTHYAKGAKQKVLARSAMDRLQGELPNRSSAKLPNRSRVAS